MTPEQLEILRRSLLHISDPIQFSRTLYQNLFVRAPVLRALFPEDLESQTQRMADGLLFAVKHLDDDAKLDSELARWGERHAEAGITSEMFSVVGNVLLETLSQTMREAWQAPLPELWGMAYSSLVTAIQRHMWHVSVLPTDPGEQRLREKLRPRIAKEPGPTGAKGAEACSEAAEVYYVGTGTISVDRGETLLAAALARGVPLLHECGGHARCTTCRVLVEEGLEYCEERTVEEEAIAQSRHLPPLVRLACQTRVRGPCRVRRLLLDERDITSMLRRQTHVPGQQLDVVVLFADIRDFTAFVEQHLAYDVTHMLNRYFSAIVDALESHGAYVDKYIGDGIMVLFGLDPHRKQHPCLDAARAAIAIQRAVEEQNLYFEKYFAHRFRCGVGAHFGPAVIGDIGSWRKSQLTALGDTVNVAARIESATKALDQSILVSDTVASILAKHNLDDEEFVIGNSYEQKLKGKQPSFRLHSLHDRRPPPDRTSSVV